MGSFTNVESIVKMLTGGLASMEQTKENITLAGGLAFMEQAKENIFSVFSLWNFLCSFIMGLSKTNLSEIIFSNI